ncbi:hypothetical protein BDZ85DRAFT_264143 [Elsinoe ampelina]|uniref:Uncharacterized protein n=1 Tax=Elsinoe ampelina TaxID=302913 RepID=A0A6A6GAH6_9PEZI|nr:hypothetical protein BDZ85DRAFT_264143 [Elsinoe ampelina]
MEVRRVTQCAIRSQRHISASLKSPLPRTPFAARAATNQSGRLQTQPIRSTRQFSACTRLQADAKDSPAEQQKDSIDGLTGMLDRTLDMTKGTPTASSGRPSHFASRQAQADRAAARPGADGSQSNADSDRSSLSDLLKEFGGFKEKARAPGSTMGNKLNPDDMLDAPASPPSVLGNPSREEYQSTPLPLPVRLGPNLGRTVKVNPGRNMDVGRAFRQLDILCSRNKVRADFNRQRFHERPGLRRKRLKRERWRKHFKEGFKGMVALVKKMKKQGW